MSAWSGSGRLVSWVCARKGARDPMGRDRSSPQPRRALSCARPALLPDLALNIWVSRGGPGRVRRAARLESLPTRLPGSHLPSPAASKNGGTPNSDSSGCRFPGAPSPQPWTPFYCPGPQRPHQPKILTTGTGFCFTASFLAVFSSFLFIMFKTLRVPVSAGGYGFF